MPTYRDYSKTKDQKETLEKIRRAIKYSGSVGFIDGSFHVQFPKRDPSVHGGFDSP
jgi:hypothetical protein